MKVLPWIMYNVYIGIVEVLLFHESDDDEAKKILSQIHAVTLIDCSFGNRFSSPLAGWQRIKDLPLKLQAQYRPELGWGRLDDDGELWERVGGRSGWKTGQYLYSQLDHWSKDFTGKPGNYKLMVKQSFNIAEGIHMVSESFTRSRHVGYGIEANENHFAGSCFCDSVAVPYRRR